MSAYQNEDKQIFTIVKPENNAVRKNSLKGVEFITILERIVKISYYQQLNAISDGIKGFILHGDVGLGKTTCAKAIAAELGAPMVFVDGADIARPLYGQSEVQVSKVFEQADKFKFAVILIDDCESVFPTRDWTKAESWHIAQNNVFFHQIDEIDSSKMLLILTTNRYDLLDKAVKDRLYPIEFPKPTYESLVEIVESKCAKLRMDCSSVIEDVKKGKFSSIRQVEKRIMEEYLNKISRM